MHQLQRRVLSIGRKLDVGGDHRHAVGQCLGNQQPVERIFVLMREKGQSL